MNDINACLSIMKQFWLREPVIKHHFLVFYLTPEQREARLKELMMPVRQDVNSRKENKDIN